MNVIEEFKKGRKFQTKDGRSARILCTDFQCETHPIIAAVKWGAKSESCELYTKEGRRYLEKETDYDLVIVPEKKIVWINFYRIKGKDDQLLSQTKFSEDSAWLEKICDDRYEYICTKSVEIEL